MAVTSPDNIWTPDSGDGYALTQDLASFADTIQDALEVRANYYTGDNSQMANQESKATEGAVFYNTDDGKEYRLVSGAWVEVPAPTQDSYNYRWADATERAAQTGMVAGDRGYQTDNGVVYKYTGTEWLPTPLYCSLSKSAQQSIGTTLTAITWEVENSDLGGMHDPSTNTSRVTVPVTGLYEVQTSFYYAATTGTSTAYIRKNGTTGIAGTLFRMDPTANTGSPMKIVATVVLSAGDYVEVVLSHSTSSNQVSGGAGTQFDPNLTVRLLGPA